MMFYREMSQLQIDHHHHMWGFPNNNFKIPEKWRNPYQIYPNKNLA